MVFDGEAMGLILHTGNQMKSLGGLIDGDLLIVKIQPSCPVMIILDHAADRDIQMEFLQHFQRDVDLALSAVHHNHVGKPGKASHIVAEILPAQFLTLPDAVAEPTGQHLPHGAVVVGTGDRPQLEFPVIAAQGLALLEDHHGTHRLKTVDIGDIVGLHSLDPVHVQKIRDLL